MVVRRGRHTKTRQRTRRSMLKLESHSFARCTNCNAVNLPHQICSNCGYYNGRQVIDVLAKLEKKERKQKEKELAAAQQEKEG
ncbi:50S ribosomal protein L32 [Candidatus Parcubacteria bacterium]|nr:MAG: 50S ribosomal protein L32 [Candidatus Parcubacteria bacterium]